MNKYIDVKWDDLGHVLVGGMTGMGKSNFLRLMVEQAITDGLQLVLIDPDGMTFSDMKGHPSLIAPVVLDINNVEQAIDSVNQLVKERGDRFIAADEMNWVNYEQVSMEKLPRVLVLFDEFNGTVMKKGGPKGDFANAMSDLVWHVRKYKINMVLAGQTFEKDIVGPVRDQMNTKICFAVSTASQSRVVLGENGAESLSHPGVALTNRWGKIKVYKEKLKDVLKISTTLHVHDVGFTKEESDIIVGLSKMETTDMTYANLQQLGFERRPADRIREQFERKGYARKNPYRKNAFELDLQNQSVRRLYETPEKI